MTEKGKRIEEVINYLKLNKNSFSRKIGMSSNVTIGRILNENRNPHPSTLQKIVSCFPQISYEWLLTGDGDMLKDAPDNIEHTNQQAEDMNVSVFLKVLAEEQSLTREALAQNSRLIAIIERLQDVADIGTRISPPLQNRDQSCLK